MTTLDDEAARRTRAVLEHLLSHVPDDDPAHIDLRGDHVPEPPAESLAEYLHRAALEERPAS